MSTSRTKITALAGLYQGRLIIAAVLFFGWLCWLGYLAAYKTHPLVVSHSQVMAASRFVVGQVSVDAETGILSKTVKVVEDLRPVGAPLAGTIQVRNLDEADVTGGDTKFRDQGQYLLMLTPVAGGEDKVFDLTRPPGRLIPQPRPKPPLPGHPWVYRWDNSDVRRQFNDLISRK